jgi:hypothetical protein
MSSTKFVKMLNEPGDPSGPFSYAIKMDGEFSLSMKEISVDLLNPWFPSIYYSVGMRVRTTGGRGMEAVCSGVSGDFEPVWPDKKGTAIYDGSLMWTCLPQEKKFVSNEIPQIHPDSGDVIGIETQAREATPEIEPPLIEEREI